MTLLRMAILTETRLTTLKEQLLKSNEREYIKELIVYNECVLKMILDKIKGE